MKKTAKKMTMKEFIAYRKKQIDEWILNTSPGSPINDTERELWIRNDANLYRWARSEGAKI